MVISDITTEYVVDYLRLDDPTDIELAEIMTMAESAKAFITGYTGLSEDELDDYPDLASAFLVLIADMFDNRNMQTEKGMNVNHTVRAILGMHSVNLV